MSALQNILAKYRETSHSQRNKGARFERLMQAFLRTAPLYAGEIAQVWLWEEFPHRGQFRGKDTGIALVARTRDGEYWAVQCKCYAKGVYIDKATLGDVARRRRRDGMPCWLDAPIQQSRWAIGTI